MDEQPRRVILQHPTDVYLQIVVDESMAAVLRKFGYSDVNDPADKLPEKTEKEMDNGNQKREDKSWRDD
jgi:hypothetical protein